MSMGGTFRNALSFEKKFRADMKHLTKKLDGALHKAAERAADQARERAPKGATLQLAEGIQAIGLRVVSTAPYSLAVELGSRPHMPPVEPILAWVLYKGFFGVGPNGKPQTAENVAWAIAMKIKAEGTKPTHFMRGTIPATLRFVGAEIGYALATL